MPTRKRMKSLLPKDAISESIPQPAEGEVKLVMDDKGALERDAILCPQGFGRQPREVHHGLRLGEHQLPVADPDAAGQRLRDAVGDPSGLAASQLVDDQKADVVPGPLVFPPGIPKPYDEPAVRRRRQGGFAAEHRPVA